jgi:phosphatidate phosphatase PAH1
MKLEERISLIKDKLNKFSSNEIDTIYRQMELKIQMAYFEEYPDVRYSDKLKKRMIQQAKRKRISKGRLELIETLKSRVNSFFEEDNSLNFKIELLKIAQRIYTECSNKNEINTILIEHDHSSTEQFVGVYKDKEMLQEISNFNSKLNFEPIWGFATKSKFSSFCESLGDILIEDEEYPLLFDEIFKLYSYKSVQNVVESRDVKTALKEKINSDFSIRIGEHDNWDYQIY